MIGEQERPPAQIRVWLLGPFLVERQMEEGQWEPIKQAIWDKYYTARPFLQRLLCAPARRVERSTLLEDLWPQSEQSEAAERYPKDAAYHLRRVLGDRELVTTFGNGSGYVLADQNQIWTDVDAVEALLIKIEREGHASPEACSRLEQAQQYLERGSFLERQMGTWSQPRRMTVERMRHRTALWLAEADVQQGRLVQAEQRYSRMLETDPLDEVVWYHLLTLLHQQGMLTQMHQSAQQMKAAFEREHVELSAPTKTAVRRLLHEPPPLGLFSARTGPLSQGNDKETLSENIMKAVREIEGVMHDMDPGRRTTILGILGLLGSRDSSVERWERLFHPQARAIPEDYQYFQGLVENGWALCNAGEWKLADAVLDSFLREAIQQAPKHQEAAHLAAQGLVLRSILQAHRMNLPAMIPLCQQAVFYARMTEERTPLCTSLNALAVAFKYNQRLDESFETYVEARRYCDDQASALVRSRIYSGAAAAFARKGHVQEAERSIGLAYEIFPEYPEHDAQFLSTDHGWYMIAYYEGLMYLALEEPDKALRAFGRSNERPMRDGIPQRNSLEILNHQGRAALLCQNVELYAHYVQEGIEGARTLHSKKRLDEVLRIFREDLPQSWQQASVLQPLLDRYPFLLQKMM